MKYTVESEGNERNKLDVTDFKIVTRNEEIITKHWLAIVIVTTCSIAFLSSLFLGLVTGDYSPFDKVTAIISYPMIGLLFYYFGIKNINLNN